MKAHSVRPKYGQATFRSTLQPYRQRGAVIVLAAIAMFVLLGAAALSIDSAHLLLNNTRAQNIVDITALSAAKTLQDTDGDTVAATADAITTFYASAKADSTGNREINEAVAPADIIVQYSETLVPFTPGVGSPEFVRVTITELPLQPWFIQIFGLDKAVTVSAVAGYVPIKVCEALMPLMVCGCTPGVGTCPADSYFGYVKGELHSLKIASGDETAVGPGNAQLLNLPGLQGCADLREAAAGGYNVCVTGNVKTKPGQCTGPLRQGLNLRFGESTGPLDSSVYLADNFTNHPDDNPAGAGVNLEDDGITLTQDGVGEVTVPGQLTGSDGPYDHDGYEALYAASSWAPDNGQYKRREIRVVVGDCSTTINGQGEVPVLGFGCYYLTQPVRPPGGGTGNQSYVVGEFFTGCPGEGVVTDETTSVYKIVLFKDPASDDS